MFLVVKEGYEVGRAYKLREGNTIAGRNPTCQIALSEDVSVSRQHVRFTLQPDGICTATDLGSTNGSFLDGKRMLPNVAVELKAGSVLRMGKTIFELTLEYSAARSPRAQRPVEVEHYDTETLSIRAGDTDLAQAQRAAKIATGRLLDEA